MALDPAPSTPLAADTLVLALSLLLLLLLFVRLFEPLRVQLVALLLFLA